MVSTGGTRGGKTIQSVETALEVLAELRRREEATLAELDGALAHSKSTLHHHLATLEQSGFVASEDGTYRLGLRLLTYGGSARAATELYDVARETVDRLAAETGELAVLVTERDGAGITLYQSTGEHVDRPWFEVGSVQPLHCTAAGKAFLAALPPDRAEALLADAALEAYTDATITEREALLAALEDVRSRGVAFDDEERLEGVRGVAAPISDQNGDLLGAIGVAGSTERLTDDRLRAELPDAVRNVVGVVEVATTYADWASGH